MRRRSAFTIVELLVSMALIIFIMVILTEAFSAGLETFRQLKAIGDMQERMRTASVIIRRDLLARHFEDRRGSRLSDIDLRPDPNNWQNNGPPDTGYFRIYQVSRGAADPGSAALDPYGLFSNSIMEGQNGQETVGGVPVPATRAPWDAWTCQHFLAFTCKVVGDRREDYRSALVPPGSSLETQGPVGYQLTGVLNSQWYEVAYFVKPTGDLAGNSPLFALYRRERAITPQDNTTETLPPPGNAAYQNYLDVSVVGGMTAGSHEVNTRKNITQPWRRFGMVPNNTGNNLAGVPSNFPYWAYDNDLGATSVRAGDDLLLADVLSFDVKVIQQGYAPAGLGLTAQSGVPFFTDLPPASVGRNSYFQANGISVFDTWSREAGTAYFPSNVPNSTLPIQGQGWDSTGQPYSVPLKIRILAIQITIRIWDIKSQQARQVTIIQDM